MSKPRPLDPPLLGMSISQAAARLGVSQHTLRRWTDAGQIECVRTPGGQRRYSMAELERFTRSRTSSVLD